MASANVMTCEAFVEGECTASTWEVITFAEPANSFDPAALDPATLATAFSAGFISLGGGLLVIAAGRAVLRAIKGG